MRPLAIAHRGASGRETENSLAAFRLARELGADGVEFDVHATGDGKFAVFHDEVAGGMAIAETPFDRIRRFRIGNGEPVPSLEEALDAIVPDMVAYVEVKTLDERWDGALLDLVDRCRDPARVAFHSFDHRIIRRLGALRPGLDLGILFSSYMVEPGVEMKASCARTVWQRHGCIDGPMVRKVSEAGGEVIAWTVDDPADMRRLLATGTRGLCSNHPDRARAAIDSLPS